MSSTIILFEQQIIIIAMKKGHRRTQSARIAPSKQFNFNKEQTNIEHNQVLMLIEASNNKVESKIINYEKLQVNNQSESSYLKFGNETLRKFNIQSKNTDQCIKLVGNQEKLMAIPENNKSSEISSQSMSHGLQEDELPANPPRRKLRAKQISDFPSSKNRKHAKTNSALQQSSNLNENEC